MSSLSSVEVEYISRESADAVLWKVRNSSLGSFDVLEYLPVAVAVSVVVPCWNLEVLPLLLGGAGGRDWQKLKNSGVRLSVAMVVGVS